MNLDEKAVSKKQQRFFGMVRAAQKGEGSSSPEVAKVASEISKKDAKDFASTKHKGLPEKKKVEESKKFSDLSTQRKPGEKKKPKKKREGYMFDMSQPPSKKVRTESLSSFRKKASDAMKRVAGKKKGDGDTKYKYPTGGGPYVDAGAEAADRIKKKGQVKAGILPDQIGTARKDDR